MSNLKTEIEDIFPEFDDKVLRKAASLNKGTHKLKLLRTATLSTAVAVGGLWFLNLPYPMIRWPVSKVAPMVLLPSFMAMDHNYRQTISLVEQADQLVNQATSAQDIALGTEKVDQAQTHLDQLPVWFLGYYPTRYCSWFSCTWRFTYDEFEIARKDIGRMEAKVFQEENALSLLADGSTAVEVAKQAYQSAATPEKKNTAIANWQAGVDQLNEIPPETLAGRMAQTKLEAYRRDLEQIAGIQAGGNRASLLIDAAQQFAWTASVEAQNAPLPPESWLQIAELWEQAIDRLEQVPVEDAGYAESQRMLAEYTNNLGAIESRLIAEQRSQAAFELASKLNTDLAAYADTLSPNQYAGRLQQILNELSKVEQGTTVQEQAQGLATAVQARLQQVAL